MLILMYLCRLCRLKVSASKTDQTFTYSQSSIQIISVQQKYPDQSRAFKGRLLYPIPGAYSDGLSGCVQYAHMLRENGIDVDLQFVVLSTYNSLDLSHSMYTRSYEMKWEDQWLQSTKCVHITLYQLGRY